MGGRGFEVSGNGAMLGLVQGFFHHRDTEGTEIFMVGWRGFEVSGNGAMSGLVGVFFHHRGTEGTEIFYGGVARIRGQWEWRDVGVGRGLFSPQKTQRAQRFLWWEGADSRSVGMALCRGWYRFFFTTEAQRAQRFFVVGRRRLERGESGGNGALLGLVGGFVTTEDTKSTEIFYGGKASIRAK